MTTKPNLPEHSMGNINQETVGHIVIDALHQILPHLEKASMAELMLAFIMMIKTTIHSYPASIEEKEQAKAILDALWPTVIVDANIAPITSSAMSTTIH